MGGSSCGKIGLVHYSHPIYQMKSCPVTRGLTTRMSEESFARMCEPKKIEGTYCGDVCRGQIPLPELELVKLNHTTVEERQMATLREKGDCELCTKKGGTVLLVEGKKCCTVCEHIRRNAKLRGDLILAQLREFHPELLADPAVGEGQGEDRQALNGELAAANTSLVQKLQEMKQLNARLNDEIRRRKTENRELSTSLGEKLLYLGAARCELIDSTRQLEEITTANDKLRGNLGVTWDVVQKISDLMGTEINDELPNLVNILLVDHASTRQEITRLKANHAAVEAKVVTASNHNSQLADDNLTMAGELEGLQDVLGAVELELAAGKQEQSRLTEEVRWLYQRLGAYEKKADGLELEIDQLQEKPSLQFPEGYDDLWLILREAMLQSATGKGLERHGEVGVPFVSQPICTITRDVGLGFPLGQSLKKVRESKRLSWLASRRELLGAIVYTAAAVIVGDEKENIVDQEAA